MIWKDIKGYEGVYQISDNGQVKALSKTVFMGYDNRAKRHFPEHILKFNHNHKGYRYVVLCHNSIKKSITIHRLVASAFLSNPENKPQINHINGIKTDNRVENLEWCNNSENQKHAYDTGLKPKEIIRPWAKSVIVLSRSGELVGEFNSIKSAAQYLKVSQTHASKTLAGLKKTCRGHLIRPSTT